MNRHFHQILRFAITESQSVKKKTNKHMFFSSCLCCNQLFSVQGQLWGWAGGRGAIEIYTLWGVEKRERSGEVQTVPSITANTTLTLSKCVHRLHANTKLAKSVRVILKLSVCQSLLFNRSQRQQRAVGLAALQPPFLLVHVSTAESLWLVFSFALWCGLCIQTLKVCPH